MCWRNFSGCCVLTASVALLASDALALTYPAPNGTGRGGPLPTFNPSIVAASLFGSGVDLEFDDITFTYHELGGARSVAVFDNANGTYDLPSDGLTLSTGDYADYADGASTAGDTTTEYAAAATAAQNALLQPLQTGTQVFNDVTQLDITLYPDVGPDKIIVDFVFGSEEYVEFQNSQFTDLFAFFVDDAVGTPVNYALIEGDLINVDNPFMAAEAVLTELDGVLEDPSSATPYRFRLGAPLNFADPTQLNILVADLSDDEYDTTLHIGGLEAVKNGDVDLDGGFDADDIDDLWVAVNAGSVDQLFDLDYDSFVDSDDVDTLVSSMLGTVAGDANLDGRVDQTDLDLILFNWGQSGMFWADGSFDGDGIVNQSDLDDLLANWGFGVGGGSSIPEPSAAVLLVVAGLLTTRGRRCRRAA